MMKSILAVSEGGPDALLELIRPSPAHEFVSELASKAQARHADPCAGQRGPEWLFDRGGIGQQTIGVDTASNVGQHARRHAADRTFEPGTSDVGGELGCQ